MGKSIRSSIFLLYDHLAELIEEVPYIKDGRGHRRAIHPCIGQGLDYPAAITSKDDGEVSVDHTSSDARETGQGFSSRCVLALHRLSPGREASVISEDSPPGCIASLGNEASINIQF